MMRKAALYVHGKGGTSAEAASYQKNCPGFDVIGVNYDGSYPWTAEKHIRAEYEALAGKYESITLIANSIGAYFAMYALQTCGIEKALFISPVLDMEQLILDMMQWAGVTEGVLQEQGEIPTDFGETLSWEYLHFVRAHPITWNTPTEILYGGRDHLISRETVNNFTARHRVSLTVMEDGEHWFHTKEQLAFLDKWLQQAL